MKKLFHHASEIDRLLMKGVKSILMVIKRIAGIIVYIPEIIDFANRADELSSYPAQLRKSRNLIAFENFVWKMKYGEINRCYFQYLFDRKHNPVDQREYLPFNLYTALRKKCNRGKKLYDGYLSYICLLRDKHVFYKFVTGLGLPTPRVVALYDKGKIRWAGSEKFEGMDSIYRHQNADLICKPVSGETGIGVLDIKQKNGKLIINGKASSVDDLKNQAASKLILQERITQHHKMARLHSGSVNTIRIATFNSENRIDVFNAILKIGAPGKVCDNWHFGGTIVGIDLDSGKLMPFGVPPTKCAHKLSQHPGSDVSFDGFDIPYFHDALALAKRLHREFYDIHTIGWDIAVTESGPTVIEGNDNWDFRMFQVYYGGCRKQLVKLLNRQSQ
jgi:hypothetical protein